MTNQSVGPFEPDEVLGHHVHCGGCGVEADMEKPNLRPAGWAAVETDRGRQLACSQACLSTVAVEGAVESGMKGIPEETGAPTFLASGQPPATP